MQAVDKSEKDREPKHTCGFCRTEYPTLEALYAHQQSHDPDGIMFSEIGLPK
jgi:hypothetical protein